MKCYKLIKDLPTFKTGEEFILDTGGNLVLSDGETRKVIYWHKELEKFPNILNDWFEEIEENEEYKRWRAKVGEIYYHHEEGRTYRDTETGDVVNGRCYAIGNYFKTEEEAEKYGEYLIALQIIKDDAKGFKPDWKDWDQIKYYGHYDHDDGCLECGNARCYQIQGAVYFKSKEDIEESFEKHRKEWMIVLGLEE